MTKRNQILNQLRQNGSMTKKQLMASCSSSDYYHNANSHFGAVLSRMVESGLIYRPKRGLYAIGTKKHG